MAHSSRRNFIKKNALTCAGIIMGGSLSAAAKGEATLSTVNNRSLREQKKTQAIFVQGETGCTVSPTLSIAVSRLCAYGGNFDVLYGDPKKYDVRQWDLIVLLGDCTVPWIKEQLPKTILLDTTDAFAVATVKDQPLTILTVGNSIRSILYAAYCLADKLKAGEELNSLHINRSPLIEDRIVSVTSTVLAGIEYTPGLFYKTVNELPRYGYTGITIIPGGQCGSPVSRDEFPVVVGESDKIHVNKFKLREWQDLFAWLAGYGLDTYMGIPPLIPCGFDDAEIDAYYLGGREPEGFLSALAVHFEHYMTVMMDTFPNFTGYFTSSTEGSEFGRHKRYFVTPEHISSDTQALNAMYQTNEQALRVYLEIFQRMCRERGKKAIFLTHIAGLVDGGMYVMRKVLYDFPEITCVEDDYWNNNLWIYDLPVMNYLPEKAKQEAVKQNFGLCQWCTDAEYYGGASLPNAYPDSLIFSAQEAVRLNARMLFQRLNLHDRTPYGTLFNMAEIIPFASMRQVWSGAEPTDRLWDEWAVRRWGQAAAPTVVKLLKNSKDIIFNGLQINGCYLLMHSAIQSYFWVTGGLFFRLLGKPGVRLVDYKPGEPVFGGVQFLVQNKTVSISITAFRERNALAQSKVNESLVLLRGIEASLDAADYQMLKEPFDDAVIVLGMLLRLGEAAYAANLVLDNFDKVDAPKVLLQQRLDELEVFNETVILPRGHDLMNPPLYEELGTIINSYKALFE